MKQIIPLLLLLPITFGAAAQSYSDSFYDALNSDNLVMQRQVLAEWQQASPDDIDLYIARFNYHMGQTLGTSSTAAADSTVLVIDQAIRLFPDRLDLRFGKIYFLGEIRRWASFADEIISTLDRSELINHRWQFPNFDQGGRILIVEGVQDYLYTLFSSGQPTDDVTGQTAATTAPAPEALPQIRRIAHRAAQLFPSEPAFFSAALHHLKRAEQLAPNDPAVLQQLVDVYTRMKDKKSAAQYRERIQAQ